jgi:N-formylmaleamate deformylase
MLYKAQEPQFAEAQAKVNTYPPIEKLIPARWSEGEVFSNGIRLHYYRTGGEKPALLLLHGFHEYGLTWLRVARELEQDYDIIMIDARGHGHSEGIARAGYPPGVNVDDLAGAIRALELDRPRIIGFSLGGGTALQLAAKNPQLVHSFIYEGWSDGVSNMSPANSESYRAWFNTWLGWLKSLRAMNHAERMRSALPQLLPSMGGSLWTAEEYVAAVEGYALFDLDLAEFSMQLWSSEYQGNPLEVLKQVSCPALIMKHAFAFSAGGGQPAVREQSSGQAHIRIVYFENTGHLIHRVAFAQYMSLVREFLMAP